jgi:hypothetical protein
MVHFSVTFVRGQNLSGIKRVMLTEIREIHVSQTTYKHFKVLQTYINFHQILITCKQTATI